MIGIWLHNLFTKIETKAYRPYNNFGKLDVGHTNDIEISKYGWVYLKNKDSKDGRLNPINYEYNIASWTLEDKLLNNNNVFIVKIVSTDHKHFLHLKGFNKLKFLYFNKSLWIQKEENIRYIINILFLVLGSYLAYKQI